MTFPESFRAFTGSSQTVKGMCAEALVDSVENFQAVQAESCIRTRRSSQAQRPGEVCRADTAGVVVKAVRGQHRRRREGAGAVELHVAAEIGGQRQGQHALGAVDKEGFST